jgi:glucosamine kinase
VTIAIGVDGGGTHARAVILDERGREVARAEAPGAVVSMKSPEAAAAAVSEAVRSAAVAGRVALPAGALWAGLAGAGHEVSRLGVERALTAAGLARRVHVGTDVEAAFHAAFGNGPGILLIAGTGSIAWARGQTGGIRRVGGWGQQLGDEGSGYALGLRALRAVARAEDGRTPPTALRGGVLGALRLESPEELVPWIATATKSDVAALVPVVMRAAAAGDATAGALVTGAVRELVTHVEAIVARAGPWDERPGVMLSGGLLGPGGSLRERLAERLESLPVTLREGDVDAAFGAAALAMSLGTAAAPATR